MEDEEKTLVKLIISEAKQLIRKLRKLNKKGITLGDAISEDYTLLQDIDKKLLDNKQLMIEMIELNPLAFLYASDRLKSDEQLLRHTMDAYCLKRRKI